MPKKAKPAPRPSAVKRKKPASSSPSPLQKSASANAPEPLRVIGIQDLSNRLAALERKHEQLARYVQNTREMLQGGDNTLRDRIDKIESTIGHMIDETMPVRADQGIPANVKFMSGRWVRTDGNAYPRVENSDDQGSGKVPPDGR